MECHRCGRTGTLARYTLGGRRAVACEACGFVNIPADHAGDSAVGRESWTDAIDRVGDTLPEAVTVTGAPTRVVEGGEPPPALDEVGGVSVVVGVAGPGGGESGNGTEPGGSGGGAGDGTGDADGDSVGDDEGDGTDEATGTREDGAAGG